MPNELVAQPIVNTILLALVVGLIGLLARIFWTGIKNFRVDISALSQRMEDIQRDLAEVRVGVVKIDTWKDGKDKHDDVLHRSIDKRLDKLEGHS